MSLSPVHGLHAEIPSSLSINAKGSKELAQVAFFAWAQLHGNEGMSENDILQLRSHHHATAILWDYYSASVLRSPIIQSSVKQILEDVGVDRSVRAAVNALKWSFFMTGAQLLTCIKVLTLLQNVFVTSSASSHDAVIPAMATAFERQSLRIRYAESQGLGRSADDTLHDRIQAVASGCEHIK